MKGRMKKTDVDYEPKFKTDGKKMVKIVMGDHNWVQLQLTNGVVDLTKERVE